MDLKITNISRDNQVIDNVQMVFYCDYLNWTDVVISNDYNEDFIQRNILNFDLDDLCRNVELSEEFMDKNSDILNWDIISQHQYLSVDFILKHMDKFDVSKIFTYQQVSTDLYKIKYFGII